MIAFLCAALLALGVVPIKAAVEKVFVLPASEEIVLGVLTSRQDDLTPGTNVKRNADEVSFRFTVKHRVIDATFREWSDTLPGKQGSEYTCTLIECREGGLRECKLAARLTPQGNETKFTVKITLAVEALRRVEITTAAVLLIRKFEDAVRKQLKNRK